MMRWPLLPVFTFILGVLIALSLGVYVAGGSHLIDTIPLPDGRERVEFYTPMRWQSASGRHGDMPAWARLVRVRDSAPLADSGVFDLSDQGQAIWSGNTVQIGTSAVFHRATGMWTIIQQ